MGRTPLGKACACRGRRSMVDQAPRVERIRRHRRPERFCFPRARATAAQNQSCNCKRWLSQVHPQVRLALLGSGRRAQTTFCGLWEEWPSIAIDVCLSLRPPAHAGQTVCGLMASTLRFSAVAAVGSPAALRRGSAGAGPAVRGLGEEVHGSGQADPREERGPAEDAEGREADDAAECEIAVAGSLPLAGWRRIGMVRGVRPPAG